VLSLLAILTDGRSQDIHFSQFWTTTQNINPALAGFFDGSGRVTINQRIQWSAVTKPYNTTLASYDFPLAKRPYQQDLFGMGVTAYRDVAGDSHFGTTQLNLSFSYIKAINRRNNNFVSAGIQFGAAQRNITYSELYFDEQFVNGRYDPSFANSEQFPKSNFFFADVSAGGAWIFQPRYRRSYQVGLSVSHLNRPYQSIFDDKTTQMDMKTMLTFTTQQKANEDLDIYPMLMASFQGTYREIIIGGQTRYIFDKNLSTYTTFNGGIYYRFGDAAYLMFGAEYQGYRFGISYDINTSKLHNASRYQGGWEISFNYIFKREKLRKIKEVPCPIF
jgi:type IX secretion system PorP/SprF family membrane protein